jgi:formate hydrogenlyase transcriptional activator
MVDTQSAASLQLERPAREFEQIVGDSRALEEVLAEVERVAPTDSTVLVLGETGTGKELIARAIHNLSPRRNRPFVKLNCAAIPLDLLESELFGHEKGAFTGAFAQKVGRFEIADSGTLFLDEIGDLPLALQPKLLRVLQEKEFERLGGLHSRRINVRVIAATHRDLTAMVARSELRNDLYYRLNVFPITLPPLRERREDIPQLVGRFVEVYAKRIGKRIDRITEETMAALIAHPWPGNVRELQNLIERAVILSNDETLANPLPAFGEQSAMADPGVMVEALPAHASFTASQRAFILRTLESTGWVIGGRRGAAAKLGLKRTTLITKMRKLGIARPSCQSIVSSREDKSADHSSVAGGLDGDMSEYAISRHSSDEACRHPLTFENPRLTSGPIRRHISLIRGM